jgi:hypothetical protein
MGLFDIFGKGKKAKKPARVQKKAEKAPKKKEEKKQKKTSELEIDRDIWPIKAVAIVEILGAPKEHVVETMNSYVEKMKKEKDLIISNVSISDVEPKEKLFSTFAEIELFAKAPPRIVDFCFDYMTSSIELLEPLDVKFTSHQFSNFFNDLQARLHNLDMLVKKLRMENDVLNKNAHFILRNNILLSLREKEKDLATISRNIGIAEEKTKDFLDALVKQGILMVRNSKYSLNKNKVKFSE